MSKKSIYKRWLKGSKDKEGFIAYPINKRKKSKGKGWKNEPIRHGLASRGIKTTTKGRINSNNREHYDDVMIYIQDLIDEGFTEEEVIDEASAWFNDIPTTKIRNIARQYYDHLSSSGKHAQQPYTSFEKNIGIPVKVAKGGVTIYADEIIKEKPNLYILTSNQETEIILNTKYNQLKINGFDLDIGKTSIKRLEKILEYITRGRNVVDNGKGYYHPQYVAKIQQINKGYLGDLK